MLHFRNYFLFNTNYNFLYTQCHCPIGFISLFVAVLKSSGSYHSDIIIELYESHYNLIRLPEDANCSVIVLNSFRENVKIFNKYLTHTGHRLIENDCYSQHCYYFFFNLICRLYLRKK